MAEDERHEAVVKFFKDDLGYGFLRIQGFEEDVFVHYEDIKIQSGYRTLLEGQAVTCRLLRQPKGLRAFDVVPGEANGRHVCPRCQHVWTEQSVTGGEHDGRASA